MQFADVLCYVFLAVTVTASCVEAGYKKSDRKGLTYGLKGRRDSLVRLAGPLDRPLHRSKVIYRRISQAERLPPPPTSQYGVPRPRYKSPKTTKYPSKTGKKLRNFKPKYLSSKYLPTPTNKHKKRSYKPRYGPPKPRLIPQFVHPVPQYGHADHVNIGFGEPPSNYANDYFPPKRSYGEPPVDSYGSPLKSTSNPLHTSPPQNFEESEYQVDKHKYYNYQTSNLPPSGSNSDNNLAYSKKKTFYAKPEFEETSNYKKESKDYSDDFDDIELYEQKLKELSYLKRNKQFFTDNAITLNRPWRSNRKPDPAPEIIVGGQYAEPPARYVPKYQPSSPIFDDNEDSFLPHTGNDNLDTVLPSATKSPYVNYKNSNMAFSPQNLNDAFSIIDN